MGFWEPLAKIPRYWRLLNDVIKPAIAESDGAPGGVGARIVEQAARPRAASARESLRAMRPERPRGGLGSGLSVVLHHPQVQLVELVGRDRRGGVHHEVAA